MAAVDFSSDFDDAEEWYDEDAIYEVEPKDLTQSSACSNIFLYTNPQNDRDGAVRAQYKGGELGQIVFGEDKADYSLTIERLVWVDGWRETTGDKPHVEMTLAVLKFSFVTKTPNNKVSFASIELRFKSEDRKGEDPEVVAWGPFRHPEIWNASSTQRRVNIKAEGKLGADLASTGITAENETSWDRIDFDSGISKELFNLNKDLPKPNGVMWRVKQNRLHKQGITPEFRVGVLLRRQSPDPYLVDFRFQAHTGTISTLQNNTKNLLGLKGGTSHVWRATPCPGNTDNCYAEGLEIIHSIDTNNLGKLILDRNDNKNLNPSWLNAWDKFEVPKAKSDPEAPKAELVSNIELTTTYDTASVLPKVVAEMEDSPKAFEPPSGSYPGLSTQTTSLSAIDRSRLISLEVRAAQAEARIAAQDQLILKLQQKMARIEHTLSTSTRGSS
ncbi:hypothetical protein F4775DRAFT_568980 [Biscogniauxia sp. FL1348]|nr:hypothetical protein F4775DRAFT_568980 [Biscogniauxia sp. FL1348]